MHYAVGMGCSGVAAGVVCSILRRGWRWIPAAMTVGGVWALVPDMPRIFREDFYWQPLSQTIGTKDFERFIHKWGDLFFFHHQLDIQPHEYALLGLASILILYNLSIVLLMRFEHQQRNSLANRAWRVHRSSEARQARRRRRGQEAVGRVNAPAELTLQDEDQPVLYRIRPDDGLPVPDDFRA